MQLKAPPPDLPSSLREVPWMASYFQFLQLKRLFRQGWLLRGLPSSLCESVAEHTLGVAYLAMIFGGLLPDLDRERLLKLALIHDLGEAHAGDLTPSDGVSSEDKAALERASLRQLTSALPVAEEWMALFEEYEAQESREACLVRQLDRLEMVLQARAYEAMGDWDLSDFFDSSRRVLMGSELEKWLLRLEQSRGDGPPR